MFLLIDIALRNFVKSVGSILETQKQRKAYTSRLSHARFSFPFFSKKGRAGAKGAGMGAWVCVAVASCPPPLALFLYEKTLTWIRLFGAHVNFDGHAGKVKMFSELVFEKLLVGIANVIGIVDKKRKRGVRRRELGDVLEFGIAAFD